MSDDGAKGKVSRAGSEGTRLARSVGSGYAYVMAATAPVRSNLDARAQTMQLRVGLVALALALGVGTVLAKSTLGPGFRALAFVPLLFASYGLLAAFCRTCGLTAIAGRRITSDGSERVIDRAELRAQRRRGAGVLVASALLAALVTAAFVFAH